MKITGYLTKDQSNIIKGAAILMIIFHNYFHIIPPAPGENEFDFFELTFERFKQLIIAEPFSIIRHSLAYFGHYGVQLFIFISGYGLAISNKDKNISFSKFLWKQVKKLYPSLLLVIILLMVVIPIYEGGVNPDTYKSLLLKLTLAHNFIPGEALSVTGPFWFFSLIVQLYILFPFLMGIIKKSGPKSMLIVGSLFLTLTIVFNQYFIPHDLNLNYLFVGHLPVFCLGIYFATRPVINLSAGLVIGSIVVFILANEFAFFWYFSFLSFTIFILALFIYLFRILSHFHKFEIFLLYSGSISLYLFAVHGIARFPFEMVSEKYDQSLITSLLSLVYLAGTFFLAYLVKKADEKIQSAI